MNLLCCKSNDGFEPSKKPKKGRIEPMVELNADQLKHKESKDTPETPNTNEVETSQNQEEHQRPDERRDSRNGQSSRGRGLLADESEITD